jgi:uncharacterized membrane protein
MLIMRKLFSLKRFTEPRVWLFAVVALVIGGVVAFTLPALFGNDEIVHFPRAYQIAQGQLWEERLSDHDFGGYVPVQIRDFNDDFREQVQSQTIDKTRLHWLMQQYGQEKLQDPETAPLAFTSAGVYAPWSYLPSALGIKLADVLHLSLTWYVWLGRLTSLIVWVALAAWALSLLPSGKLFMVAIALLPTSLVQAANLGMDGVVNGLAWVIIAMTFAVLAGKIKLTPPRILLLAFLCFFLATTKQGYLPIALFPIIIPARLYRFDKKLVNIMRVVFATLLVGVAFQYIASTLPLTNVLHYTQRPGINVDSHAQILHIAEHPFEVLYIILIQPFTVYAGGVWAGTVGVITNKVLYLPVVVIGVLYATLLLAFTTGSKVYRFAGDYTKRVGIASIVVGLATFLLINLALYVAFTRVGNPRIEGLQGRYFLPFAPLAIGALNLLPPKWHHSVPTWVYAGVGAGTLLGLASALFAIVSLL